MILRRLGNKSAIAREIQKYFPSHKIYIEPFFGAGGMFFNKPKAQHNILNDLDSDVFNLFNVIIKNKNELLETFELTPYCTELFEYWKKEAENEPIKKAVRFIYLSNFGYLGQPITMNIDNRNHKYNAILNLKKTEDFLKDCSLKFTNFDFRKAIESIKTTEPVTVENTFIYCDPPYLGTGDNYSSSFTEQDSIDLFNTLQETGCKWAMSEFDNHFIIQQAKERNLIINTIGERRNLREHKTEILITNYSNQKTLFD